MKRSLRPAAIGIAALAGMVASYAQGTFIVNGKHYIVHRDNIPDFDQRKTADASSGVHGLPGNGSMWCVPTSVLNNLTYLANHGYPLLGTGPGNWAGSAPAFLTEYNHVTNLQLLTGILFHTDPESGTGGVQGYLQAYLDAAYPGQFAVGDTWAHEGYTPSIDDAAYSMLSGGLVTACYGRYTPAYYTDPQTHDRKQYLYRDGGHCVTVVGAQDWNGTINVALHDPANPDDDDLLTQSTFLDDVSTYHNSTDRFGPELDAVPDVNIFLRTMQVLDYSGGYLDDLVTITPKNGFTYQDDEILFMSPNSPSNGRGGAERPLISRIDTGIGRKITDLKLNPYGGHNAFLVEDTDAVFQFNPVTQEVTRPIAVSKPKQLAYGGDGELYVLRDRQLDVYDRSGHRLHNVGLQQPVDAIAWDFKGHRLIGYSRRAGVLYIFDQLLNRDGRVELGNLAGPPDSWQMFVDDNGNVTLYGRGSRSLIEVAFDRNGDGRASLVAIPSDLPDPRGAYVDEKGRVFLLVNGMVVPLDAEGRVDRLSKFFGLPAGDALEINRPFANMRPDPLVDPAYINVLPPFFTGR